MTKLEENLIPTSLTPWEFGVIEFEQWNDTEMIKVNLINKIWNILIDLLVIHQVQNELSNTYS